VTNLEFDGLEWIKKGYVGSLTNSGKIPILNEMFLLEGLSSIRLCYIGDNLVFMLGDNVEDIYDLIKNLEEWMKNSFESIEPWKSKKVVSHRLT